MPDQRQPEKNRKTRSSRTKKRTKPPQPTHVGYVLKVMGSTFHYSLSLGNERWAEGAYSEMSHLTVEGILLAPKDLKHPSRMVLNLIGRKGMLDEADYAANQIGGMAVRPDYIDAFVQVPSERISLLAHYLDRNADVRYNLVAERIRWRTAHIWAFSMTNAPIDEGDL